MSDEQGAQTPDLNTPEGRVQHNVQMALANPQNVPPKFHNEDGSVDGDKLTEAYLALERKQSGAADPTPAVEPAGAQSAADVLSKEPSAESAASSPKSVSDILDTEKPKAPDVDWDSIRMGNVTEQDRAKLDALGIPSDIVIKYAQGDKLTREAAAKAAGELVGGEEQLKNMLLWAQKTMDADEWNAIREAAKGPQGKIILVGLNEQYKAANKQEGETLITPTDGGVGGDTNMVKPFGTQAEMMSAFQAKGEDGNPKYDTDPVYRHTVERRLWLTNNPGGDIREFDKNWDLAQGRAVNY